MKSVKIWLFGRVNFSQILADSFAKICKNFALNFKGKKPPSSKGTL